MLTFILPAFRDFLDWPAEFPRLKGQWRGMVLWPLEPIQKSESWCNFFIFYFDIIFAEIWHRFTHLAYNEFRTWINSVRHTRHSNLRIVSNWYSLRTLLLYWIWQNFNQNKQILYIVDKTNQTKHRVVWLKNILRYSQDEYIIRSFIQIYIGTFCTCVDSF
jgi:hypothetical protein